jgi:oxepin-CoA hydrolase/3-oxo-5,6-dehydrosuberyl-CoA semialdehyde dehydrogenase
MLRSYANGTWFTASDEGTPLLDAVTGDEVDRISSSGLDVAAMVDYGRRVGGPALRELTFHDRAAALKAAAAALGAVKDEFYELSLATGATRTDAAIDIDGGIGTMLVFASKGRRELPNDTIHLDGAPEILGKRGRFVGQHIYASLHGVAVQINAFNFPVWGMLEKLAPAFLAGVPTVVKPASQTAYLTELVFRRLIEADVLPAGSVQLLCGGVGDLLDHLTGQDIVSFTGSASTARRLRTHPAVAAHSVRFNAEADSLNLSMLGPDAVPGTAEFDLFVREVAREMTVKAGQKCTAIRRALVPAAQTEAVVDALRERLANVPVGDPRLPEVRMGALASLGQRDEVRRCVAELARDAAIVVGSPDQVDVLGADAGKGAFLNPILLLAADSTRPGPHTIEAFGPVSTVLPYDSVTDAVGYAGLGGGSLVGSLFTADPDVARAVLLGIAPYHGRLLVLDADGATESTGHGSPLGHLVHGGPGRAGGGEELGGIRGVLHFMQRTALQGSPDQLSAVTGRWLPGASRRVGAEHPFRRYLEDLQIGDTFVSKPRTVTLADIEHFAEFTGDTFYAHMDEEAAKANPLFGGRVAHGYLVLSFAAGLFVDPDPGPVLANYGLDNLRFAKPVSPGDTLQATLTAMAKNPRRGGDDGQVRWDVEVRNAADEVVAHYELLTVVAKRPA